ncbi:MAG: urease accessory protein UreD [Lapillicoccus sp.]
MSVTRLSVAGDPGGGRVRVVVASDGPRGRGHLGIRVLDARPDHARVALLAEGALLLAGDEVGVRVDVGPGVHLEVVEPAGTVAYDMRGGEATWAVSAELGPHARLVWRAEPFVVSSGARVRRTLDLHLRENAVAVLRETLVLGRSAESGGTLQQRTRVTTADGPLLAEDLEIDGARPQVGVLGGSRVLDTVAVLGTRAGAEPTPAGAHRLELDGCGTLLRALLPAVHLSPLEPVWRRAVSQTTEGTERTGRPVETVEAVA